MRVRRCRVTPREASLAAPPPSHPVARFGFNDDAAKMGRITAQQESGLLAGAGASVERTPLPWGGVEPQRGNFDWSTYDRLYAAYRARGIRPIWSIQWAPAWSRDGAGCPASIPNCVPVQSRAHDGDWGNFIAAVVRRYPESAAVEIWNEENSVLYWGGGTPNPGRYAEVLRAAFAGARSANPYMPVVLGGLADVTGAKGTPADAFLQGVYRAGAGRSFDAVGYHPYPALPDPIRSLRSRVAKVRDAKNASGGGSTPLWITETGASNVGETSYPAFSEPAQASAIVAIYRTLAAMPDVQAVVLHRLIDMPAGDGLESGFGALHQNLNRKPAYCAIARERGKTTCA